MADIQGVLDQVVQAGNECKLGGSDIKLLAARKRLADSAAQLLQLATEPTQYLEQLNANNQHLVCLRWLVNLNVLEHVPLDGSVPYAQLAAKAGVPEHQLKSVVRMAAAHGFLQESSASEVAHTPTSKLIATDESFLNWARWLTNYSVPSAYRFPEATKQWGTTEKKTETAFNIAMDVQVPFFAHLKANSEMNGMFSSYMRNVASAEATSFKHLISGFEWARLPPKATVVDVGGSGGHGSRALADAFPGLDFIVQDLPDTIKNAKATLNGSMEHERVRFMDHDFFTPQPITDADIYLLRMIIHDWPDETAILILTQIKNALLKKDARVVVMDTILPRAGKISLLQERQLRVRDLTMMQVFNAKEREYEDWQELVAKAGLRIVDVRQPEGSNMGLLELALAEPLATAPRTGAAGIETSRADTNGHRALPTASSPATGTPEASTHEPLPVLIMGAGISGLCLAQALHKQSVPFQVFERDPSYEHRPQGYRLKLEGDAAAALRESLTPELYEIFEASCANSYIGETDFDPISGQCIKSRAGGGLANGQGLRATYTVDRSVFRRVLMTGIEDKIYFGREFERYDEHHDDAQPHVLVTFRDGTAVKGRFAVGADGTRSNLRKQLLPKHRFLEAGATCIYGKTVLTPEFVAKYPKRALRWMTVASDTAPLIQSILIGSSPLTLLSEPIIFSAESRAKSAIPLPDDYVYWVLIGRQELFTENTSTKRVEIAEKVYGEAASRASANQSLQLTEEWHENLRLLFEKQDVRQASTMRVVSAPPKIQAWEASRSATVIGDAVHAMSPCGGVGANTALRDAAELGKLFANVKSTTGEFVGLVAEFDEGVRKRAFPSVMRSYVGSKAMFDQKPFEDLPVVED